MPEKIAKFGDSVLHCHELGGPLCFSCDSGIDSTRLPTVASINLAKIGESLAAHGYTVRNKKRILRQPVFVPAPESALAGSLLSFVKVSAYFCFNC
jgi:hypothetical protein